MPRADTPTPRHLSPGPMAAFPPAHTPALPLKTAARVIAVDAKAQKGRSPFSVPRVRVALLPPHSSGADPAEYGGEVLCGGRGKPLPGRPPQAATVSCETQLPPSSPGQALPPELPEEAAAVGVGRAPSVLSRSCLTGHSSGPLGWLPQEEVSLVPQGIQVEDLISEMQRRSCIS